MTLHYVTDHFDLRYTKPGKQQVVWLYCHVPRAVKYAGLAVCSILQSAITFLWFYSPFCLCTIFSKVVPFSVCCPSSVEPTQWFWCILGKKYTVIAVLLCHESYSFLDAPGSAIFEIFLELKSFDLNFSHWSSITITLLVICWGGRWQVGGDASWEGSVWWNVYSSWHWQRWLCQWCWDQRYFPSVRSAADGACTYMVCPSKLVVSSLFLFFTYVWLQQLS